jgi:hypothetical protein
MGGNIKSPPTSSHPGSRVMGGNIKGASIQPPREQGDGREHQGAARPSALMPPLTPLLQCPRSPLCSNAPARPSALMPPLTPLL